MYDNCPLLLGKMAVTMVTGRPKQLIYTANINSGQNDHYRQSLPKIALAPTPGDTITSYPKFAKVTYSTLPFCLCPCLSK